MIAAPKAVHRPDKMAAAAPDAKARELYGNSALAYGYNRGKRDGALMSAGADWTNAGQQAVNTQQPVKGNKMVNADTGVNTREQKYKQLQSSVFGGGYQDNAPVEYDREAKRNAFGSAADWKTEAGMQKPMNAGSNHTDTFRQRQKQLASSVLPQSDQFAHMPISKKAVDIDNAGHQHGVRAQGRKVNDEFKQRTFEPAKASYDGYNARGQKQGNLASALDKPVARPTASRGQENPPDSFTIAGRETKATKQAMLASNDPITGQSSMAAYNRVQEPAATRVVDLQLKNLPSNTDLIEVKKMSGARHVISAALDEDNMKGICLGTGRIQIRLNQGENLDDIELNFASKGIIVNEHTSNPGKKPAVTG